MNADENRENLCATCNILYPTAEELEQCLLRHVENVKEENESDVESRDPVSEDELEQPNADVKSELASNDDESREPNSESEVELSDVKSELPESEVELSDIKSEEPDPFSETEEFSKLLSFPNRKIW